jgi:hypothetical protein
MKNFKNTTTFIALMAAILFSFNACHKTQADSNDSTKPVITVVEPMADDTLSLAVEPEIHVEFTVTDETGLHNLSVLLIKNNTDTLMNETPAVNELKVFSFHEHAIPTGIVSLVSMKAIIKAADHGGNVETKIIDFFVEP